MDDRPANDEVLATEVEGRLGPRDTSDATRPGMRPFLVGLAMVVGGSGLLLASIAIGTGLWVVLGCLTLFGLNRVLVGIIIIATPVLAVIAGGIWLIVRGIWQIAAWLRTS